MEFIDRTIVTYHKQAGESVTNARNALTDEVLNAVDRHLLEFKQRHLPTGVNESDYEVCQYHNKRSGGLAFLWILAPAGMNADPATLIIMGCPYEFVNYAVGFDIIPPATQQ